MATTDRTSATADADAVAGRLREASFAHLLVRADGESIAAGGLLADACVSTETPYQVSVVRTREDVRARTRTADDTTTTVALGVTDEVGEAVVGVADRPCATAFEAADDVGDETDPDPVLALAGVVAGGATPEMATPAIVERAGLERRPGLATPSGDLADGLAHTTLAHADFSGDLAAAEAVVETLSTDGDREATDRRLASVLAIDAVTADDATDRAAEAIERAMNPLVGGPLATVGGYADVLCALSATAPGRGVALALGSAVEPALGAWRNHAEAAHRGVRTAEVVRHDGLLLARTDGPVETVARLLRDFRSPEPAVLALADGEAALATVDAPAEPIEAAAAAAGGSGLARGPRGYARFDADREDAFVDAVTEAT